MLGINENKILGLSKDQPKKAGHQTVELYLSCRNLKNKDLLSKSDPQIRVYSFQGNKRIKIGETEMIRDNLNPDFVQPIKLDFIFEIKQQLIFEIIDIDSRTSWEDLGEAKGCLGEIMGARNQTMMYDIILKGKKSGTLVARGEAVEGSSQNLILDFKAKNLLSMVGLFGTTQPCLEFSRTMGGGSTHGKVYESFVEDGLHPRFETIKMNLKTLANDDMNLPISASIYHVPGRADKKKLIGTCTFTVEQLKNKKRKWLLKNQRIPDKVCGYLECTNFKMLSDATFLQYVKSGIQLSVILAVDFTGSNGHPKDYGSLHYMNPIKKEMNQYQQSIHAVCDILLDYDYDKKIPMYGFGAKLSKSSQEANHCFALTMDEGNPFADGLDGIMQVYENVIDKIDFSGPSHIAPVIKKAIEISLNEKANGSKVYTILLVMTDGIIHDMKETIDDLVSAANLPMSVVIVGVGGADFSAMQELDGDEVKLKNRFGVTTTRDIVQFVPFNKFKGYKEKLAEEVLAEIPGQFLEYMNAQGISLPE